MSSFTTLISAHPLLPPSRLALSAHLTFFCTPLTFRLGPMEMFPYARPPFLSIPLELQDAICREPSLRKKDLARLALTCRSWYIPANVVLWEYIIGLGPLLALMPEGTWNGTWLAYVYMQSKWIIESCRYGNHHPRGDALCEPHSLRTCLEP